LLLRPSISEEERKAITDLLWKEMREIYYGRNIPAV
jgi:S-adenosylmethionine decarboxylase